MTEQDLSIPLTPQAITPEWLTRALRQAGILKHADVVTITVTPITAGSGFVGQTARLLLTYSEPEPSAPAAVFAKLSSADPAVRQQLKRVGIYKTEAGFYRDVAFLPDLPVRVPRPYLNLYDDDQSVSLLLLEDLSQAEFGDNLAGCSATDAQLAVRQLGLLHAHCWKSPMLGQLDWLCALTDEVQTRVGLYQTVLPRFEQRCAELQMPHVQQLARRFGSVLPTYFEYCSTGPQTLTHGDFRADNLAFAHTNLGREVIIFDWQVARRSRGPRDLAYFLSGSMSVEQRRTMEASLLSVYHETLMERGVRDYSVEALHRDYQAGLGAPLTTWVVAGGMLDFSSARGSALFKQVCERLQAALDDHQFESYLDRLA